MLLACVRSVKGQKESKKYIFNRGEKWSDTCRTNRRPFILSFVPSSGWRPARPWNWRGGRQTSRRETLRMLLTSRPRGGAVARFTPDLHTAPQWSCFSNSNVFPVAQISLQGLKVNWLSSAIFVSFLLFLLYVVFLQNVPKHPFHFLVGRRWK